MHYKIITGIPPDALQPMLPTCHGLIRRDVQLVDHVATYEVPRPIDSMCTVYTNQATYKTISN